jgi:hypothetical protein
MSENTEPVEEIDPVILIDRMLTSLKRDFSGEAMLNIPRGTLMALLKQMKNMANLLREHGLEEK